ncbi:unnamed protein product [Zymoseptoria tritici ST99CH_1E4]|uniref:Major facilitator superfamily (MFS) profile domain-containing protein n=1 Tax=Zymoseptoria tritici ST99CH_1E4 TaxID=1276532 RepID=A0A2H1GJU2_ZYMTR|nr:unnamed protein product [Zymoseptoria tritici ST99CH_1E4]
MGKHIVNTYNLLVVIFVALGTLATAYGLAIIGSTVGQPSFYTYFDLATQGTPGYKHTTNIIGGLNGLNSAGAIVGCLFSAWSGDVVGRKRTIEIGCYACYYFPSTSPSATFAWRFPLALQIIPPLLLLAGSKFIPFSPRWLLSQSRPAEALSILKRLHATPSDPSHTTATAEFYLMQKQFALDSTFPSRRFEIFRSAPNRRRALIGALIMWGNQFLGIFIITNYGVLIYASLGFKGSVPLLLNACWTTFTLLGNVWTAFYIDRFGRRTFMLIGTTGCVVSLIFLCAMTASFLNTNNVNGLNAAVFFIWFYILWWCFFVDATQYVYVSEIWPNRLRSQGTAWGVMFWFLASEVTLVAAPVALNEIGWKFYLVLIVPSTLYISLIYLLFPETKGRTLEEIGLLFGDDVHVASQWYDLSPEEKEKVAEEAVRNTALGSEATDTTMGRETMAAKGGVVEMEDARKV